MLLYSKGNMNLQKGILTVLLANIITLIISIITNFIMPQFLSINEYARIKTFLLYISYLGVMHWGFIDGVYITFGGKKWNDVRKHIIHIQNVFWIYQGIIALLMFAFTVWINDKLLIIAVLSIIPGNTLALYKMTFQACGEFKEYRFIQITYAIILFFLNISILFFVKKYKIEFLAMAQVVSPAIVSIYILARKKLFYFEKVYLKSWLYEVISYLKIGFTIMLGNFMCEAITSIDRWFVKFFCKEIDFSHYSFAVSMMHILNTIITAISVVLYHFFCKKENLETVNEIRKMVQILASFAISCVYFVEIYICNFMREYLGVNSIICLLFSSQYLMINISVIYINLYKVQGCGRKYFLRMVEVIIISIIFNVLSISIWGRNMLSIASATFLTAILWIILCQIDFPKYRMNLRDWIYVFLILICFNLINISPNLFGVLTYIVYVVAISCLLYKNEIQYLRKLK